MACWDYVGDPIWNTSILDLSTSSASHTPTRVSQLGLSFGSSSAGPYSRLSQSFSPTANQSSPSVIVPGRALGLAPISPHHSPSLRSPARSSSPPPPPVNLTTRPSFCGSVQKPTAVLPTTPSKSLPLAPPPSVIDPQREAYLLAVAQREAYFAAHIKDVDIHETPANQQRGVVSSALEEKARLRTAWETEHAQPMLSPSGSSKESSSSGGGGGVGGPSTTLLPASPPSSSSGVDRQRECIFHISSSDFVSKACFVVFYSWLCGCR